MSKSKRHRFLLLGLPIVLVVASLGAFGSQEAQGSTQSTIVQSGPLPAGKQYTVTLLTGDIVTVVTRQSGCPLVTVKPAKPSGIQLRSCDVNGHARVVPIEAASMIGSVLDEALFDVTTLIREGYDDASTKDLPLIVRQQSGIAALSGAKALPSISSVAVKQPKEKGADFLRSLQTQKVTAAVAGKGPLVRLDRRVRVNVQQGSLDRNLKQVSAPQAWASGYTGRGVNVAVLDTGADISHPDLVGQVAERADFVVEGGEAIDGHGHGTHVASTIAGSGAAASGERRGVAPGAKLVVGKVLDDYGFGSESQIIAGMEWAAARAKVVNMSLGGWEPSDGTDPMSLAVNTLTAQHGTLFVVAAGNDGPEDNWITSPAAAADALTVGAVDRDDKVADFSSRGPVINTRAAKPELVAPGVEIVAARAAGTSMGRVIDSRYTAASGTSMASPHAAGGAAILAQRYPNWTSAQLKNALVGAVDPLRGADTYVSGSGRLNVARALSGAVSGQPIVHLGIFAYPQSGTAETKLSWPNGSARLRFDVTTADRSGTPAPAGSVTLNNGKLSIDRARFAERPGFFSAVVTARTAWGELVSTTPVTFYVEPPTFDLTLTATPPPNTPVGSDPFGYVRVVNLDDPAVFTAGSNVETNGDPVTLRVPAGRYSVMSTIYNFPAGMAAMVGDPDIAVNGDTALVLDAAQAKSAKAAVEGVGTVANQKGLTYVQTAKRGPLWFDWAFAWGEDARRDSVFAGPVRGVGIGKFEFFSSYSLVAPGDQPSPFLYDLTKAHGNGIPEDMSITFDKAEQAQFSRIDQKFHVLDMPGSNTLHKRYAVSPSGIFVLENSTDNPPAQRVDYLSPGFSYVDEAFFGFGGPFDSIGVIEARRVYQPGSRQELVWVRQPMRPDWYDDPETSTSGCVPRPITRTRGQLVVELVELADQHQRFNCLGLGPATRNLALYRNGELVGEFMSTLGQFDIPPSAATYRLTYDLDASAILPVSTRVSTAWTFRSAAPKGTGSAPVALLSVDYALALDAANHPRDGRASFTVRQAHGVARQHITSFVLFTSVDDGARWQPVTVRRDGNDTFSAELPRPAEGQAISLRLKADASAGSAIEQTIIRAYK
ncbi:MAG TPA: hypothetical protein DGG94_12310 [Micromonosporaceae bacterium]|nr:hypothetical protein [Micromonosporaceae bacterium]